MRLADFGKMFDRARQVVGAAIQAGRQALGNPPAYGGHPRPIPRHPAAPAPAPQPPWPPAPPQIIQPLPPTAARQPLDYVPPSYALLGQLRALINAQTAGQFAGRMGEYIDQLRDLTNALQQDTSLPGLERDMVSQIADAVARRDQRVADIMERRRREAAQAEEDRQRQEAADEEWPEEHQIDVTNLGRADVMQWPVEMRREVLQMRKTPGSSNVYAYTWYEDEQVRRHQRPNMADMGTMIVTFKDWEPGQKERNNTAGPTYAYSHVSRGKFEMFEAMASETAGGAVWDFLRLRGTISGHQHPYRLLSVTGDYIPRKATAEGFARRMLPGPKEEQVARRRSTLEPGPLSRFGYDLPPEGRFSAAQARAMAPSLNAAAEAHRNRGTPNNGRR